MYSSNDNHPLCYSNISGYNKHYSEENDIDGLEIILEQYFFKVANSFGLSGILEEKDLYLPDFFDDWDIQVKDELLETPNGDIVTTFHLNESCKAQLLQQEEYPYQPYKIITLPNGKKVDKKFERGDFSASQDPSSFWYTTYYQYTYFFDNALCLGYILHYETQCAFTNAGKYMSYLDALPSRIRLNIETVPERIKVIR